MENKPIESRFTKKNKTKQHSKSDTSALNLNDQENDKSKLHKEMIDNLTDKNAKLTQTLEEEIKRNKRLLKEYKQKKALQAQLEDQKNTTKELEILTSVCVPKPTEPEEA